MYKKGLQNPGSTTRDTQHYPEDSDHACHAGILGISFGLACAGHGTPSRFGSRKMI